MFVQFFVESQLRLRGKQLIRLHVEIKCSQGCKKRIVISPKATERVTGSQRMALMAEPRLTAMFKVGWTARIRQDQGSIVFPPNQTWHGVVLGSTNRAIWSGEEPNKGEATVGDECVGKGEGGRSPLRMDLPRDSNSRHLCEKPRMMRTHQDTCERGNQLTTC